MKVTNASKNVLRGRSMCVTTVSLTRLKWCCIYWVAVIVLSTVIKKVKLSVCQRLLWGVGLNKAVLVRELWDETFRKYCTSRWRCGVTHKMEGRVIVNVKIWKCIHSNGTATVSGVHFEYYLRILAKLQHTTREVDCWTTVVKKDCVLFKCHLTLANEYCPKSWNTFFCAIA